MPPKQLNIQSLIDASTNQEEKELLKVFPEIVASLQETLETEDHDLEDAKAHFKEVVEYNVPHGKKVRALMLMESYREMVKNPSKEEVKFVQVIAWCYEMHFATFCLCDELIFDKTVNEEGRPCYHKVTNAGVEASNDAYYMECAVYVLLEKYIKDDDKLVVIEPMFQNAIKQMLIGQNILQDTIYSSGETDFSTFNEDKHSTYVKYRTAYYSFFLPVKFAMYSVGNVDEKSLQSVEEVALKLGHYAHVKEEYLNCYGRKEVFGKSGSNIAQNKITWLIVKALNKANGGQKEILKANYGRPDKDCIEKVKAVYNDLDIQGEFRKYEKKTHEELLREITKLRDDLPKQFFLNTTNNILSWEDTLYFLQD